MEVCVLPSLIGLSRGGCERGGKEDTLIAETCQSFEELGNLDPGSHPLSI